MNFSHLLPTVAGVCGSMFVGYCVYLDRKRRSATELKTKLHEQRNPKTANKKKAVLRFPKLDDAIACQRFLMLEMGKASQCMDEEKIDDAISHLANSLSVCDAEKKFHLMKWFAEKYSPEYIEAIIQRIPEAEKSLRDYHSNCLMEEKEKERKIGTRSPYRTEKEKYYEFIKKEIALRNKCEENGDLRGASYHSANVSLIANHFFSLILRKPRV